MPAVTHLASVILLMGIAIGTGQLLARAFGLRRLQWLDAGAAAASALLGAASWTIGFSVLSGAARLPAPTILAVMAAAHVVLMLAARRRRAVLPKLRGSVHDWLLLGGAVVVTTVLALLPVILSQSFRADNDTHTYCALAEWLQQRGFGTPLTGVPRGPGDGIVELVHRKGVILGATYPLALMRAARLGSSTLGLYAAVSAFGLTLSACGVWWLTRNGLRLGRPVSATTACLFATAPHAAYWAHHNGFLLQTYAVPGLLLGLAALARPRGVSGRFGLAAFSAAAAYLYVVYLPFFALLAAGALAHWVTDLARARRDGRTRRVLTSWLLAVALPFVLVGLNLTPLLRGVPHLLRSTSDGRHVPLEPISFAAISLGPGPGAAVDVPRGLDPGAQVLAVAAALLVALGIGVLWHERRGRGLLAASLVLAGLLGKAALFAQDPWTGDRGNTWLVFKVVQYAFPVALILQAAGLAKLAGQWRGVLALVLVASLSLAPAHLPWSLRLGDSMVGIPRSEQPLAGLDGLLKHFRDLPPGQLVLLGQPERVSAFRGRYAALFAYPRSIAVVRQGSTSRLALEDTGLGGVVPLLAEAPPFDRKDRTELGGGFALLTAVDRPRLVQVVARRRAVGQPERGGLVLPLARTRTKLLVLAPRPGPVELSLRIEPAAGRNTSVVRCRIIPGAIAGPRYRQAVRSALPRRLHIVRGSPTVVRFTAEAGLNAVVLNPEGPPQRLVDVVVREGTSQDATRPSSGEP